MSNLHHILLKINGIPQVCEALTDQANCARAVELCGANTDLTACTVKMIGIAITSPDGNNKVLPAWWGFGKDAYHVTMKTGHNIMVNFVHDLVHNVGGHPGEVGAAGKFISNLMGVQ